MIRTSHKLSLSLALLATSTFAQKVADPGSRQAEIIRAKNTFLAADKVLNDQYKLLRGQLTPAQRDDLAALQADWIGSRTYLTDPQLFREYENPEAARFERKADLTKERIGLFVAYTGENTKPGLAGHYSDFTGGALEIRQRGDQFYAYVQAFRGNAQNHGSLEGRLVFEDVNSGTISYREEGIGSCTLRFKHVDAQNRIYISEVDKNECDSIRGFNAFFSGTYLKSDFKDPHGALNE